MTEDDTFRILRRATIAQASEAYDDWIYGRETDYNIIGKIENMGWPWEEFCSAYAKYKTGG